MDTDSPIEWTNSAHEVTVTCPLCDETHRVPETTAEHCDGDVICSDCHADIEGLWCDLFIRNQSNRLSLLADYMNYKGFDDRAAEIRELGNHIEEMEEKIRVIGRVRDNGKLTEERLSEMEERLLD